MYLALVLLGFLHDLVFLPVIDDRLNISINVKFVVVVTMREYWFDWNMKVFLSMFGPAPRHVEGDRQDHRPSVSSLP